MAQRSPHNPRYQKHTKPEGKTRRSAASAKPKRSVGATASASSSKSGSRSASARSQYAVPMTPEYRKWRNVWWGALGISAACAIGYLLARRYFNPAIGLGVLVACYVFLGIAFYVDWRKVRPAREAAIRGTGEGKGGST